MRDKYIYRYFLRLHSPVSQPLLPSFPLPLPPPLCPVLSPPSPLLPLFFPFPSPPSFSPITKSSTVKRMARAVLGKSSCKFAVKMCFKF